MSSSSTAELAPIIDRWDELMDAIETERLLLLDCKSSGSIAIRAVQDERLGVCIGLVWNQRPGVSLGGQNGFLHRLHVLQPANREIGDVLVAQPHVFLTVLVDFGGPLHGVVADQRAVDQVRAPEIVDEQPIDKWRPHRRIAQNVLADQPLPQHRSVAMVEQKLAARQSLPAVAVAVAVTIGVGIRSRRHFRGLLLVMIKERAFRDYPPSSRRCN